MVSSNLQHSAILSLGGMAKVLTRHNPDLANEITDVLSSILDHVTGRTSSSRLRRSSAERTTEPSLLRAALLDSIGNSQDPRLFTRLVDHVTSGDSLTVKHAALKAIGRYDSVEVHVLHVQL